MVKPVVDLPKSQPPMRKSSNAYYLGRDGALITHKTWAELVGDPTYTVVRHYMNDRFQVLALWSGGPFDSSVPREHARPFIYKVLNAKPNGGYVEDPSERQTLRTEKETIALYEAFLVQNDTGCEWVADHFIERGNKLAPPDKAAPAVAVDAPQSEAMGSW